MTNVSSSNNPLEGLGLESCFHKLKSTFVVTSIFHTHKMPSPYKETQAKIEKNISIDHIQYIQKPTSSEYLGDPLILPQVPHLCSAQVVSLAIVGDICARFTSHIGTVVGRILWLSHHLSQTSSCSSPVVILNLSTLPPYLPQNLGFSGGLSTKCA